MARTTSFAVVRAHAVRHALELLTEIAAPLRVRVTLTADALSLTTHGMEPWWATVSLPADVAADGASACVARLDFRQAVDAEAVLVPDNTCSVTIVDDDVVRYGAFAFAASSPGEPPPPTLPAGGEQLGTWQVAGGRYEAPDGRVFTVPTMSLDRFHARSIEDVVIVDGAGGAHLVGAATGEGDAALTLIARGSWS